jgi:toxin ParE2
MNIILIPPADKELNEAIAYYNDQFSGLGDSFYEEFIDVCRILSIYPRTWRKIGENTHRINFKKFPYLILYVIDDDEILITCIAHHHRNPTYYVERIY